MTPAEARALRFIIDYQAQHDGASPTFTEMMAGLDLASKGGVARVLTSLERQGKISREFARARSIRVLPQAPPTPADMLAQARSAALIEAANYARFYGEERARLAGDGVILDLILAGKEATQENVRRSRDLMLEGTINSAAFEAASHIATHLEKLAVQAAGLEPAKVTTWRAKA